MKATCLIACIMKKAFLTAVLSLVAALGSYGQGTVNFANSFATRVFLEDGMPVPAGSTFLAELMFAPDGTPLATFDAVAVRLGRAANFGGGLGAPGVFQDGARTAVQISPGGGFGFFQ